MNKGRVGLVMAFALAAAPACPQGPDSGVEIRVRPMWSGPDAENAVGRIVTLQNGKKPVSGMLEVRGAALVPRTPVELPPSAKKEYAVYPQPRMPQQVAFQWREGMVSAHMGWGSFDSNNLRVAAISDVAGQLNFLREERLQVIESTPEAAPARVAGYTDVPLVILLEGAERLRDEQVAAIQTSVRKGSALLFVGGASTPLWQDPRWRGWIPFDSWGVVTRPSLRMDGLVAQSPISLTTGRPSPGARAEREGEVVVSAARSVGYGEVIALAYNPFEPPLNRDMGRVELFRESAAAAQQRIAKLAQRTWLRGMDARGMGAGRFAPPAPQDNPFDVRLPNPSWLFGLLAGYFLLAIPVNFWVLRRVKRGEWAWFTAPLLSLGCAAVIFSQAGSLYASATSRASTGLLLGDSLQSGMTFVGSQQLFFPSGGRHDLELTGVDFMGSSDYGFGRQFTTASVYDLGQFVAPDFEVPNLAFHEFDMVQSLTLEEAAFELQPARRGSLQRARLENRSGLELKEARVLAGGKRFEVGTLAPGQTIELPAPKTGGEHVGDVEGVVLTGLVPADVPVAAQVGTPVESSTKLELWYTLAVNP